jgi:hypothetical protein
VRALFAAMVVGAFAPALMSCGGDDGLSAKAYFRELAALDGERARQTGALLAQLDGLTESDALAALPDNFDQRLETFSVFIDGLYVLDPPEDLIDFHDELLGAYQDLEAELRIVQPDVDSAESMAATEALLASEDVTAAALQAAEECEQSERLAAERDAAIDLDCEGMAG